MRRVNLHLLFLVLLAPFILGAQENLDPLFINASSTAEENSDLLVLRLEIPIKTLRKETNDSTYIPSTLFFKENASWDSLAVQLRTRGEFRLKQCVFPPVKIKISKADAERTVFQGHRKLKLVVPCKHESDKNDNVVKEYMAYKLLEPVTPYHFRTRLVELEWSQRSSKKNSGYQLKGILLEDIEHVAERMGGNEYDRAIHPMRLDTLNAIRNAFFQYMIGNDDYSVVLGHNRKALYLQEKFIVIPYDFDLSRMVNADYGKFKDVQNLGYLGDTNDERMYRDYPREVKVIQKVRQEYLSNQAAIMEAMNSTKRYFDDEHEFKEAELYVKRFFQMLEDDKLFERRFLKQAKKP